MVQDQGSCDCNSPKTASKLQFGGVISGMLFFWRGLFHGCILQTVTFHVIALTSSS
jgi:hypothetical protein